MQNDAIYPIFLYHLLEECWQQDHLCRPSAALLHTALVNLTGLSVKGDTHLVMKESMLLDSFLLHQNSRVSAVHSVVVDSSVLISAALSSLDENHTTIMSLSLRLFDADYKIEAKVSLYIHCT